MGVMLAEPGYHTRAFVEWEDWPRAVLIAAQRAEYFAPAPIWNDLRSFDARPFCGAFDIILAGYPCQPFSAAGKRGGADDPRHLWPDVARVIGECRPEWVFLENVPGHVTLSLETVLRELWGMGYTPAAGLFSAAEVGAPHQRMRIFILAHTDEPASRHRELQPGREQRLHAEGGGAGVGHHQLVNAQGDRWREGWPRSDLWLGWEAATASAGRTVANAGCGRPDGSAARQDQQSGRTQAIGAGAAMAHSSRTELEGFQRGQHHPGGWQVPDGFLHYRAEQGFTRPVPAITPHGPRPSSHAPISRPLWASMIASHGRVVSRRILKGRSRRRLNPLFVGWLMGWPIGHALCACSATEFTLWQQLMRGALSHLPMASGPWIWRPETQSQRPAQMTLFEGMLP
jgi:DNA (cytosine-5)-methyltransferase 1